MLIRKLDIGDEKNPLIVADDFLCDASLADISSPSLSEFSSSAEDHYPGKHCTLSEETKAAVLSKFLKFVAPHLGCDGHRNFQIIARLSRVTQEEKDLSFIQCMPHTDSSDPNQIAMVLYLCAPPHGGTSFFRHRETGFEAITADRIKRYDRSIKRLILRSSRKGSQKFMNDSDEDFDLLRTVDVSKNRAIFYRSCALHAGRIHPDVDIAKNHELGRLTLTAQFVPKY